MITKQLLLDLTQHIDRTQTECDGASRLVHLALIRSDIPHTIMCGWVFHRGQAIVPIHYWVKCDDWIIDYRAQMWYGPDAPHGVFKVTDYPSYAYMGEPIAFSLHSCYVVETIEKAVSSSMLKNSSYLSMNTRKESDVETVIPSEA